MRTIYFILKNILKNELKISYLKSIFLKYKIVPSSNILKKNKIILDRLFLIFGIFAAFFFVLIRLKKSKNNKFAILLFKDKKIHNRIKFFINYYKGKKNLSTEGIDIINVRSVLYKGNLIKKIPILIKLWWSFLKSVVFSFTDKEPISFSFIIVTFIITCKIILISSDEVDLYFFRLFKPEIYLSSLIISKILENIKINLVCYNHQLFIAERYMVNEKANLIFCSDYQIEEAKCYMERKWIQVKSYEKWGPEEVDIYKDLKYYPPSFEIGLYSSGNWARVDGLWRSNNIDDIKNLKYWNQNIFYRS